MLLLSNCILFDPQSKLAMVSGVSKTTRVVDFVECQKVEIKFSRFSRILLLHNENINSFVEKFSHFLNALHLV